MSRPVDARKELFRASKQRSKKRRTRFLVVAGSVVFLLLLTVVASFHLSQVRIATITVQGANKVPLETLTNFVSQELSGNRFLIIPNNTSFLVGLRKVGKKIITAFPDIDHVVIRRVGFTGLDVKITERTPAVLWCTGGDNDRCFYTDHSGLLFAEAPQFSDNVMMKLYGLLDSSPIGKRPLSVESFKNLLTITSGLPTLFATAGLEQAVSTKLTIDKSGDVRVTIAGALKETQAASSTMTWDLLFNQQQDLMQLSSTLRTVFTAPEFRGDLAEHEGRLNYIDVRFGKKVFYTFK